jgi:hypothetical protein
LKKLTEKQKLHQFRIARFRFENRLQRTSKKKTSGAQKFVRPGELIVAPTSFDLLRGSGGEVVKFIKAVTNTVLVQKLSVKLDFKRTEQFFVPGAILLFAELDRIVNSSDLPKPITVIPPVRRKPREVMKQIGIFELTNDDSSVIPKLDDVIYWRAIKGQTQTGSEYGPLVDAVAERANQESNATSISAKNLWRGVNEAVANSVEHAYKFARRDGFSGLLTTKWWMFTSIRQNRFTIAVCDLGCGYKNTVNETIPEQFRAGLAILFSSENRDSLAIRTAMEYGRSSTNLSHRGKGSRDALSVLENHGSGELFVFSNSGSMRYAYDPNGGIVKESAGIKLDIGGTIVWWNLPIGGNENANS